MKSSEPQKNTHQQSTSTQSKKPFFGAAPEHTFFTNERAFFQPRASSQPVVPIQAKLTIGQPGDKYEQEADRVASQVVEQINAPTTAQPTQGQSVQRQEEKPDELQTKPEITALQRQEEKPEELQAKSTLKSGEAIAGGEASPDLASAINTARGNGQPLEAGLQSSIGQAMGADFSGVKVHTDTQADQLNRSIQAKAFTTGQDVFFRQGAYQPGSRGGQELIAHELTHVVQQNGAAVQPTIDQKKPSEHLNGLSTLPEQSSIRELSTNRYSEPQIQRELSDEQRKGFTPVLKDLRIAFQESYQDKLISPDVKAGLKILGERVIAELKGKDTTAQTFTATLDEFSEKLDIIREYRETLADVKEILKSPSKNLQRKTAIDKLIDYFEFDLKYEDLAKITSERGENGKTLYALKNLAWENKGEENVKIKKPVPTEMTEEESAADKKKDGPGSYAGFEDLVRRGHTFKVTKYGENETYEDEARTIPKDFVRMYQIKWNKTTLNSKQHTPWVLHIHFTLQDKLTVAHFKRYKNHKAGAGTNLSNYDGTLARKLYQAMETGAF